MLDSTTWLYAALVAAGVSAGFVNTLAGGGSLLTLPVLMLLGLPADVANGTNRLSIVSQSLTGVWAFRRGGHLAARDALAALLPAAAGALLGAWWATLVPAVALHYVLLAVMLSMVSLMAFAPTAIDAAPDSPAPSARRRALGHLALFAAGIYGGFVQAGVGFVLLGALGGALRYDLTRANALKLVCTLAFGVVALAIFARAGQIVWLPAAVLAAGTAAGSLLGVRFALRAPRRILRWIIFAMVAAASVAALVRGPS